MNLEMERMSVSSSAAAGMARHASVSYGNRAQAVFSPDSVHAAAERTRYRDAWYGRRQAVDPARILVVDADFLRGASTRTLVHTVGWFETRGVSSAQLALSVANEFLPGVVLLSTELPALAGYSLAAALHEHPLLCSARLIALTTDIVSADRQHALAVGFEQYLTLPVQQTALERVLVSTPASSTRM